MPGPTFSVVLESRPAAGRVWHLIWAPAAPVLVLVLVLVPCAGWCDFPALAQTRAAPSLGAGHRRPGLPPGQPARGLGTFHLSGLPSPGPSRPPRPPPPAPSHSPGHGAPWQPFVSRPLPLQPLPPIWGTGELQRRIRVMLPTPQVAEQEDHGDQWLQPPSCRTSTREAWRQQRPSAWRGGDQPEPRARPVPPSPPLGADPRARDSLRWSHLPRLQARVWMEGPRQVLLVTSQDLPLCWVPGPQVTEHWVHSAHGDQPSSPSATGRETSRSGLAVDGLEGRRDSSPRA